MVKSWTTMQDDSEMGKNGRAMLGEESKWLVLLGLVKDRLFGRRSLENFSVQTTYLIMGQ